MPFMSSSTASSIAIPERCSRFNARRPSPARTRSTAAATYVQSRTRSLSERVERHPRQRSPAALSPIPHRGGLAVPGRRHNEGQQPCPRRLRVPDRSAGDAPSHAAGRGATSFASASGGSSAEGRSSDRYPIWHRSPALPRYTVHRRSSYKRERSRVLPLTEAVDRGVAGRETAALLTFDDFAHASAANSVSVFGGRSSSSEMGDAALLGPTSPNWHRSSPDTRRRLSRGSGRSGRRREGRSARSARAWRGQGSFSSAKTSEVPRRIEFLVEFDEACRPRWCRRR